MKFYGKAEDVGQRILDAFRNGQIPEAMKNVFWNIKSKRHSASWSLRNRFIMALHGYSDARGFGQWTEVGRNVKKGEKAFYILAPIFAKKRDELDPKTNKPRQFIIGFKGVPVFGYEQTEGKPLEGMQESEDWISKLPLIELAKSWGVETLTVSGSETSAKGAHIEIGNKELIALAVKNLSTWAHELVHAAEKRVRGELKSGQHWDQEVVAELGGAILLECLGFDQDSDRGGCFEYVQRYALESGKTALEACMAVLDRTLKAVAFILEEAEKVNADKPEAEAVAA